MEAASIVTLERRPSSAMPLTAKMTLLLLETTADTAEDGSKTLRNVSSENGVDSAPQGDLQHAMKDEARPEKQLVQPCSSVDQSTGEVYSGSALSALTKEHRYRPGNTVTENAEPSPGEGEDDPNGCCHESDFLCLLQEDPVVMVSDGLTVNGQSEPPCPLCSSKISYQVEHPLLPTNSSSPANPLSATLPGELPRIIKHKTSSITFADYTCPPAPVQGGHGSSDSDESSSVEEDDNVFTEMLQSREIVPTSRRRKGGRRRGIGGEVARWDPDSRTHLGTAGNEAEEEGRDREVRALVYTLWVPELCSPALPLAPCACT